VSDKAPAVGSLLLLTTVLRLVGHLNTKGTCMKIRFSLRLLLVLLTIATIFFGIRLNQRRNLQHAAMQIEEHDGTVFFCWQSPYEVAVPVVVPNAYYTVEVPYTETGADGQEVEKVRTESAGRSTGYQMIVPQFRAKNSEPLGFSLTSFLLGTHSDVDVAVVSIAISAVDEKMTDLLGELGSLETVVLKLNSRYYSVKASNRSTADQRKQDLQMLEQERQRVTKILEENLPNVYLHFGIETE